MSKFADKCKEYFDTTDFYEVLGVKKTASAQESKVTVIMTLNFLTPSFLQ